VFDEAQLAGHRTRATSQPRGAPSGVARQEDHTMLADTNAIATIAVKDIEKAKKFYADTLGLKQVRTENGDMLAFKSGNSTLNVYRSRFAGTNQATAVTWSVGDELESLVRTLKGKGVKFEHYDMPNTKVEGDIHVAGDMKVAWFKDPDGNILNLVNH
jgi:catechol 2,3-dioxygenase-like lactoylglutathione lyase family enzyme